MKNLIIRFKKILAIGIAVLVGIVLAVIILRTEKTTVKDSHEGAESPHEGDEQVKGSSWRQTAVRGRLSD